jgi:hypothetical protein
MKMNILQLFLLSIFILLFVEMPYNNALSEKVDNNNSACPHCSKASGPNTIRSTPYKPVKLLGVASVKNITTLRTTTANISSLQFTTSYNYQYITWSELLGRNNVIFVASSRDGGHTFDTATNLSSSAGDASNAHFVVNLDHMYGVFVQHQSAKNDVIKFTGTSDGGTHWNTFTLVDPHGLVYELAIALQGDQVSVVWSNSDNVKTINHYILNG